MKILGESRLRVRLVRRKPSLSPVEPQMSHFANFTPCEELVPILHFWKMVSFDNFGSLTSVLKFHIFLIFNCEELVRIVAICERLVRFFSDVKNWYQIFTDVKNWYLIFTDVNGSICNNWSHVKDSFYH